MSKPTAVPSVSVTYAQDGTSTKSNALGMRPMQERAYQKRGEQYLLIKSPPASGKSRALMFIALDKLENQGLQQAIVVVPEKSIGSSFHDEPLSQFGFWADWHVEPRWNLCDAPGGDNGGKVDAVKKFLNSDAKVLVCTHATFRFAVEKFGVEVLDNRLIAVDEFHHVSANPDNKLGDHIRQLMTRDKTHIVAMTGSYFRGDAEAVLHPEDEAKFDTVTYTYYEQLNGYQYLKQLDIGYYFYSGSYTDAIMEVLNPHEKTILHIPNVNSRESTKDKIKEVEHIIGHATRDAPGKTCARFTNLIAEPDAAEAAVTEAVNDTLKAIAASLLMEQVLAPRFEFRPKRRDNEPTEGFDYGEEGYDPNGCNVGVNPDTGQIQIEIKGLAEPKSPEKDKASRRITNPDLGLLFSHVEAEDDLQTGYIYVLRSQSDDPFIAEHRSVIHKIGITGGDVKKRIANAKKDPTYLLADVEIVATFKLANINRTKLEALLHKFFDSARLDVELKDRFGIPVQPREWFFIPLSAIEEAIEKIQAGTLHQFQYDPKTASLAQS